MSVSELEKAGQLPQLVEKRAMWVTPLKRYETTSCGQTNELIANRKAKQIAMRVNDSQNQVDVLDSTVPGITWQSNAQMV